MGKESTPCVENTIGTEISKQFHHYYDIVNTNHTASFPDPSSYCAFYSNCKESLTHRPTWPKYINLPSHSKPSLFHFLSTSASQPVLHELLTPLLIFDIFCNYYISSALCTPHLLPRPSRAPFRHTSPFSPVKLNSLRPYQFFSLWAPSLCLSYSPTYFRTRPTPYAGWPRKPCALCASNQFFKPHTELAQITTFFIAKSSWSGLVKEKLDVTSCFLMICVQLLNCDVLICYANLWFLIGSGHELYDYLYLQEVTVV